MEKILEIINTVRVNADMDKVKSVKSETSLRDDLNFDSINLAELTVRIEDEYDVDIFENGIVQTVGEIENILKS